MSTALFAALEADPALRDSTLGRQPPWPRPTQLQEEGATELSAESTQWKPRAASLFALAAAQGMDRAGIARLLQSAFTDADARVRGTALVIIIDLYQSDLAAATLAETSRAIMDTFGDVTDARFKFGTREAVAQRWLRQLGILVGLARQAARFPVERRRAAVRACHDDQSQLQNDASAVARFLQDRSEARRSAALHQAAFQRDKTPSVVERIVAMTTNDPSPYIRRDAVFALATAFGKSRDARILRHLAGIVEKEGECLDVRRKAYLGLMFVADRPLSELPLTDGGVALETLMDHVDWAFVRSCASTAIPVEPKNDLK